MASDSSTSTTPMLLTPESTGTGSPDSSASSNASSLAVKKTRRQTAIYPNVNSSNKPQKPFSRSAAKRESVMMLGSIEHLQHYFTKTGIAAKKKPLDKPHHGLVPAIGGLNHIRTNPSLGSLPEFQLPPSPVVPPSPRLTFPPFVKTYETDPESLLPGVIDDLSAVAQIWQFNGPPDGSQPQNPDFLSADSHPHNAGHPSFDVLGALKTTTRAIRSIRNYLLSLPDESAGTIRAQFRPRILTPAKPAPSNAHASPSTSPQQPDPLTLIRRSALEVLTVLRELEESCRLPLSDDAYDVQSDGGNSRSGRNSFVESPGGMSDELPPEGGGGGGSESSGGLSSRMHEGDPDTSITFSLVHVQGRYESVPVWEDEEDPFRVGDEEEREREKREYWDERLVLGSGWLYRQDVRIEELGRGRGVVAAYLDVVDEVLFGGKKVEGGTERGWERERRKIREKEGRSMSRGKARRVSAGDGEGKGLGLFTSPEEGKRRGSSGMVDLFKDINITDEPAEMEGIDERGEEDESIDDEELPEWAKRSLFIDDDLGRASAILQTFLPPHLCSTLAPPSSRTEFLTSLSSGQLLCVAYNSCVRKSKHPWGYVSKDGIHDILALEKAEQDAHPDGKTESGKKGWTFRRSDNLRLWAGALKLRYLLPIHVPSQPIVQGSKQGINTPLSSPGPAAQRFPMTNEPPLMFDARVVAKREDGWEEMLEAVLVRWVRKVVDEKRGES